MSYASLPIFVAAYALTSKPIAATLKQPTWRRTEADGEFMLFADGEQPGPVLRFLDSKINKVVWTKHS